MEARKVSKQFLRKREDSNVFDAVKTTDFCLNAGEFTILYGASGSGKSTFLNMLAGIQKPSEGEILLDGSDLYQMRDAELARFRNEKIGVIPQGYSLLHNFSVLENVLLPYEMYHRRAAADLKGKKETALDLLENMGIRNLKDVMPSELSGGEAKRAAIARALIMDPEVILADEPTADLDSENSEIVLALLQKIAHKQKRVLVVTHDPEAMKYADVIYYMENGVLGKEGKK